MTVTVFDMLGVGEDPAPAGAAAALWPLGFVQGTTGVRAEPDPGEVPLLVDMLQSALTFRALRPGAEPGGVGVSAELIVGTTATPLVLAAMPDIEFQPLPTSGGPARVYARRGDGGTEIVVEALPVEIRLPRRMLMPLEDQPEVTAVKGFVAGLHDTIEVKLRRDEPSTIRVHVKVRMTEERDFVIEPAVPISIGECRFSGLPCRGIHDLGLVPSPVMRPPHDISEQALDWTRHSLEPPEIFGLLGGGVLTMRTLDLHDGRPPFDALADKPNEERPEESHVELVAEDIALPMTSYGLPTPIHFTLGLRRKLEFGDDPFGSFDLTGLPVRLRIAGFARILADWLIVEQLLVRSIKWSQLGDTTPESQFIFLKALLSDSPDAQESSGTITVTDEWTIELGWRHDPGKNMFKLFGAQFTLLGVRGGVSILRLAGDTPEDSWLVVGDVQLTLVGRDAPDAKVIRLESASGKSTARVINDFGYKFGSPSLGHFWDPNGAKLTACDSLRFDIDEFGFVTEAGGGRYIAFSGTIPLALSPATPAATDDASTTTDTKAEEGIAFRFYRVRGKIGGPQAAPDTLIDGIGLSCRLEKLTLTGFGSISERREDDGHHYKEMGLALQLRLGAAGAEFVAGGHLFHGTVSGPQDNFTYWLVGAQVSPIPIGSVTLRNVRALGASNMAPQVGPADVGNAQPMPLLDWYRSHNASLELAPSRNLSSNGWGPVDDAWAVGGGFTVELCSQMAVWMDAFGLYSKTPSGSGVLVVLQLIAFGAEKPVAFGALEIDGDRWSVLVGLSIGTSNLLGKPVPFLENAPLLSGTIYATNKPGTLAIGHINDTSSWLALRISGDLWVFRVEMFAGICLEIVEGDEGPRVFGLRVAVTGGSRFLGIGGMDFHLTLQLTAGVWRTESKVSGFVAYFDAGAHFDVFFVFDFGASFRVQWDYLGPDPAYRRVMCEVKIHTPWWLPDATFRWNKTLSQPVLEKMRVVGPPLIETSAQALAKKAPDPLPVTPLVGDAIVPDELLRIDDVAGLGDAVWPAGALDDVARVAVDSVIALHFSVSVDDKLVWGQNTPAGMGTQGSEEVSATYELAELGIRRRARYGLDAGVWTTLLAEADSRQESLTGLTPNEVAERMIRRVSLLWDGDFLRDGKLDPRRLLVNAEVPYLTAVVNLEVDELLVINGQGWPCCGGGGKDRPRWHTLDFRGVPTGQRAAATQRFTESTSTLHWVGELPPVVGPGRLFADPTPVARVMAAPRPEAAFARVGFDAPAAVFEMKVLWQAMHLRRRFVVTPFRGLKPLPEQAFGLDHANLTRIRIEDPDGITHVLLRLDGRPVPPDAGVDDWLELADMRYRSVAEVQDAVLQDGRCGTTNDDADKGGKRFAWMANHDYELGLRVRITVKDERSGSLVKELQQRAFFTTKGLPGLNAAARVGEEIEPYVESRYPPAGLPLYRTEPAVLAFNERYDVFAALERPPEPDDPPERRQAHDLVLAVEKIGGEGVERRMSQTAADWILAHRGTAPQPQPPKHRPPYVIGGNMLDPIVHAGVRSAPSLDPLQVRYDAVLTSPYGCGLTEPPERRSRTLSHVAVDPDEPDVQPRRWPGRVVLRASVRRKDAPFVEREPFEIGDETALTRFTAWDVVDGAVGPAGSAASRQLAVFGEATWEHLLVRVTVSPAGGEAGLAVAVGGFSLGSRALLALVDPVAGRLRLVARRAGSDVELAGADLVVTEPVVLEVTAYDDRVHARVGELTVSAERLDLREGRLALVAGAQGARFSSLRVEGLELYHYEFETSRYADLAEHVGSFGGSVATLEPSADALATVADLVAGGVDPSADKLDRQRRFDAWVSGLALLLRARVERLELTARVAADGRVDLLLLESPEPLPIGEDVTVTLEQDVQPSPIGVPVAAIANGDRTATLLVPSVPLEPGPYRLALRLDRARYRSSAADSAARLLQEASLEFAL